MPPDLRASLAALPGFTHPLASPLANFGHQCHGRSSCNPLHHLPYPGSYRDINFASWPHGGRPDDILPSTLNYHHPRTKHYDDKMEKQRLEHILFSGADYSALDRQKERMRRKLKSNLNRKNVPKPSTAEVVEDCIETLTVQPPSSGPTPSSTSKSTNHGQKAPKNGSSNNYAADKRKKKRSRHQRRKGKGSKQRNKRRSPNHKKAVPSTSDSSLSAATSSLPPQCKINGGESTTESVSVSMSTSASPYCVSSETIHEVIDQLHLERKTVTTSSNSKGTVPSDHSAVTEATEPSDSSVGSRDIDDGDHEDSFIRQMDPEEVAMDTLLDHLEATTKDMDLGPDIHPHDEHHDEEEDGV